MNINIRFILSQCSIIPMIKPVLLLFCFQFEASDCCMCLMAHREKRRTRWSKVECFSLPEAVKYEKVFESFRWFFHIEALQSEWKRRGSMAEKYLQLLEGLVLQSSEHVDSSHLQRMCPGVRDMKFKGFKSKR